LVLHSKIMEPSALCTIFRINALGMKSWSEDGNGKREYLLTGKMVPNPAEYLQASPWVTKSQPINVGKIKLPKLLGWRCLHGWRFWFGVWSEGGMMWIRLFLLWFVCDCRSVVVAEWITQSCFCCLVCSCFLCLLFVLNMCACLRLLAW